jgi:hypothetical protein
VDDHRVVGRLARVLAMSPARAPQGWGCRQWRLSRGASGDFAGGWQHPLCCLTEEREHAEYPGLHWSRKRQQKLGRLKQVKSRMIFSVNVQRQSRNYLECLNVLQVGPSSY